MTGGHVVLGMVPRLDPSAAPVRQLVEVGWDHDVELPMVEPDDLPPGTDPRERLEPTGHCDGDRATGDRLRRAEPEPRRRPGEPACSPSSPRHSLLASAAAVARQAAGRPRAVVEPVGVDRRSPTETETWATRLRPTDVGRRNDPTVDVRRNVIAGAASARGRVGPRHRPRPASHARHRDPSTGSVGDGYRLAPNASPRRRPRERSVSTAGWMHRSRVPPEAIIDTSSRHRSSRPRSPPCCAIGHNAIRTPNDGGSTSPRTLSAVHSASPRRRATAAIQPRPSDG